MRVLAVIVASVFATSCANSGGAITPWEKLLSDPSQKNFQLAERMISSDIDCSSEWYSEREYAESLSFLFDGIIQGNEYSFKTGLLLLDCLDGGNLGDAYRSIGLFYDNNPLYFSKAIDGNKTVSDMHLKHMLTMLPLETADNIPKKIDMLSVRIQTLSIVEHDIDHSLYSKMLSILTTELKFFQKLGT